MSCPCAIRHRRLLRITCAVVCDGHGAVTCNFQEERTIEVSAPSIAHPTTAHHQAPFAVLPFGSLSTTGYHIVPPLELMQPDRTPEECCSRLSAPIVSPSTGPRNRRSPGYTLVTPLPLGLVRCANPEDFQKMRQCLFRHAPTSQPGSRVQCLRLHLRTACAHSTVRPASASDK
jgi:hypothetical protein